MILSTGVLRRGNGLVGMGLRVVFCLDIVGGVQEESTGLVDASVV